MMEHIEVFEMSETAYTAAMMIVETLGVSVTLKQSDDGKYVITWSEPVDEEDEKRKHAEIDYYGSDGQCWWHTA